LANCKFLFLSFLFFLKKKPRLGFDHGFTSTLRREFGQIVNFFFFLKEKPHLGFDHGFTSTLRREFGQIVNFFFFFFSPF
jgi:hypothetical protein